VVFWEDGTNQGPSTYPISHRGAIAPIPVISYTLGHLPPDAAALELLPL
jgi:hypothetical protein